MKPAIFVKKEVKTMSLPVKALVSVLLAVPATIAEETIKKTTRKR